jgi:hypothetical protein
MPKTQTRKWCEETAHEFGCSFTKKGKLWTITQKSTGKVAYQATDLSSCQKYLLNEIAKYMGKRMGVRK